MISKSSLYYDLAKGTEANCFAKVISLHCNEVESPRPFICLLILHSYRALPLQFKIGKPDPMVLPFK